MTRTSVLQDPLLKSHTCGFTHPTATGPWAPSQGCWLHGRPHSKAPSLQPRIEQLELDMLLHSICIETLEIYFYPIGGWMRATKLHNPTQHLASKEKKACFFGSLPK